MIKGHPRAFVNELSEDNPEDALFAPESLTQSLDQKSITSLHLSWGVKIGKVIYALYVENVTNSNQRQI